MCLLYFLKGVGEHLLAAELFPSGFVVNFYRWVTNSICHVLLSKHGTWLLLSTPDLWPLAIVSLSDPPLTFAQQALKVSCCEMKAMLTSRYGQLCFVSLVWLLVDVTYVIIQQERPALQMKIH